MVTVVSQKSTHLQRVPTTFGPNSCIGSKFTQVSTHRGVSVSACTHGVWKVQPCTLWGITNFMLYFTKGYYMVALCRQTYNAAYTASYSMLMVTVMTPSSVLCTIKIWLWSCWQLCCMLLFVQFLKWVLFRGSVWKQLKVCPLLSLADL